MAGGASKKPNLSITATTGAEILQVYVLCVYGAPMLHFSTLIDRQVVEATVPRAKEALDEAPPAIADVYGVARTEHVTAAHAGRCWTTATLSPS